MILEVGLGGRLDATNIVDADVAGTSIALDHTDWLGRIAVSVARKQASFAAQNRQLSVSLEMPLTIADVAQEKKAHVIMSGR